MKRIVILFLLLILCSGCKNKEILCTFKNINEKDDYEINIVYRISYKNNKTYNINIAEIYESNDFDMLDYFEEYRNIYYEDFNNKYGGTEISSNTKDMVLTIKTNMDFEKIDLNKMVDDKLIKKTYIANNYLTKNGAILYVESLGGICND